MVHHHKLLTFAQGPFHPLLTPELKHSHQTTLHLLVVLYPGQHFGDHEINIDVVDFFLLVVLLQFLHQDLHLHSIYRIGLELVEDVLLHVDLLVQGLVEFSYEWG